MTTKTGVTGTILSSDTTGAAAVATAPFGHALVEAGERDPRIVGLTADLGKYTDMHLFAERFPDRFFQIGMAEQNLIGANAQIGAAKALYFPTISLTGLFGGASTDL